jgi:hypothetical protein
LDLAGAFIDFGDTGVTVVPLGWHLCHIPHASQDLDGLSRTAGTQEAEDLHPWGRCGHTR